MESITKSRNTYIIGMILMVVAGYALLTCGSLLFHICDVDFPVLPLAVSSALLVAYNVLAVLIYINLVRKMEKGLVSFYLASKIIRLVFVLMLIVGTCLLTEIKVAPFAICFFLLYIGTVVYESVFFVQIEKKTNELSK
ncbi:MAG: hypothetical protein J1F13_04285 [Prevotellaceae bacterium]|nr:hypothetical protein [Prevotellaceae bacterium]